MPVRKDINFNAGFTGCEDRMAILRNETVPRRLDDFTEVGYSDISTDMYVYVDDGDSKKIRLGNIINSTAAQADWDETNEGSYSYIWNKPEIKLTSDLTSLYNVGGVKAGDKFEAGTSLYDIIASILTYTERASGLRFGILNNIPEIWTGEFIQSNFSPVDEISYNDMMSTGLVRNFDVNNQFYVLAIPSEYGVKVTEVTQEGLKLDFIWIKGAVKVEDLLGNVTEIWDLCLPTKETFPDGEAAEYARATGSYTVTYKFAEIKGTN